jgi:hypothetical protein
MVDDGGKRFLVFISYRRQDLQEVRDFALALIDHLEMRGVVAEYIWLDELQIQQGVQHPLVVLKYVLSRGVAESRRFLAFVSPAYFKSEWCCFEWATASALDTRCAALVMSGELGKMPAIDPHNQRTIDVRPYIGQGRLPLRGQKFEDDVVRPVYDFIIKPR